MPTTYYEWLDTLACLCASNHEEAETLLFILLQERDMSVTKFAIARARFILGEK